VSPRCDHNNNTNQNMKTLINITAHAYTGSKITTPERRYSFVRPSSAKTPTYAGAARMIASEIGCRPKDVSVTRVETMVYDAR
jgi:hypothetical protein